MKRGLRRGADDVDLGPNGADAIFSVVEGGVGLTTPADETTRLLFRVTEVFEPAGAGADAVKEEEQASYAAGIADDLLDQLVARLRGEFGVTSNPTAIQQALSF